MLMGCLLIGAGVSTAAEDGSPQSDGGRPDAEGASGQEEPLFVPSSRSGDPAVRGAQVPPGGGPGLDALLKLPSGFVSERSRPVAGANESEWRRRFDKAVRRLAEAKGALGSTKRELDEIAETGGSNQWSVAPPVGGNSTPMNSPLSFKLRQELKRNREELEVAERSLRELRIEADLAGVPQSWRGSPAESVETQRN
ncbi:MAG: hypothetical protein CL908_14605 [Deltaproteobacteria bacterium]|nr:hypothetical protein [Deltaproteobacteria bacterium]